MVKARKDWIPPWWWGLEPSVELAVVVSRLPVFAFKSICRYDYEPLKRHQRVGVQSGAISTPVVVLNIPLRIKNGTTRCGGGGEFSEKGAPGRKLRRWSYLL